jgi:hypothetical protein
MSGAILVSSAGKARRGPRRPLRKWCSITSGPKHPGCSETAGVLEHDGEVIVGQFLDEMCPSRSRFAGDFAPSDRFRPSYRGIGARAAGEFSPRSREMPLSASPFFWIFFGQRIFFETNDTRPRHHNSGALPPPHVVRQSGDATLPNLLSLVRPNGRAGNRCATLAVPAGACPAIAATGDLCALSPMPDDVCVQSFSSRFTAARSVGTSFFFGEQAGQKQSVSPTARPVTVSPPQPGATGPRERASATSMRATPWNVERPR